MAQYTIQSGVWADETIVQQLRDLWDEGHSCSQIARKLGHGITRNSVIGKATRLGLPARGNGSMSRKSYTRTASPPKPKLAIVKPDDPLPPFLCEPNTIPNGNSCRFIKGEIGGEWHMCGHPGHPWCDHHRTVVYDKPRTEASQRTAEQNQRRHHRHVGDAA